VEDHLKFKLPLRTRNSWLPREEKIMPPTDKKSMDLKNEWNIIWIKDSFHAPLVKINIINPNWLKVDIATVFFKSVSKIAEIPAIKIVNKLKAWIHKIFLKNKKFQRVKT